VNNTNISSPTTNSSRDTTPIDPSGPLLPGVTTRDRSRIQWTAPDVYDQKAEAKKIAMEETAAQKRKEKADRQTNRVLNAVYGTTSPTTSVETNGLREMIVNDLRFRVATNGTKLIRIFGKLNHLNTAVDVFTNIRHRGKERKPSKHTQRNSYRRSQVCKNKNRKLG